MMNLLQNAVRYTADGKIEVVVNLIEGSDQPRLKIEVIDTGRGIPTESLSTIFDNFSRLDETVGSNSIGRGLGLGLPITQALVTKMEGTISVESQIGKGTAFTVVIPMHPVSAPIRPLKPRFQILEPTPNGVSDRDVLAANPIALVIDDSPTNRLLMRKYLRRLGFRSIEADSISEAMKQWERFNPAVVLLDRHLSDSDGLELIERLKQRIREKKSTIDFPAVFLVTAYTPLTSANEIIYNNVCPEILQVLYKPLSLSTLQSAFEAANILSDTKKLALKREPSNSDFKELQQTLKVMVLSTLPGDLAIIQSLWISFKVTEIHRFAHRIYGAAGNAGMETCGTIALELASACDPRDDMRIELAIASLQKWVEENSISVPTLK
jgi:CheY-like chemotaxis protein/anti-sigma regulatory factor (Ser/Thr protein kinase)